MEDLDNNGLCFFSSSSFILLSLTTSVFVGVLLVSSVFEPEAVTAAGSVAAGAVASLLPPVEGRWKVTT